MDYSLTPTPIEFRDNILTESSHQQDTTGKRYRL